MDRNFKELMDQYTKHCDNLFEVKKRIFTLFSDDNVLDYINELIIASNEKKYLEGEAIGYTLKATYYIHFFDEYKKEYIEKADRLFKKIPDYEKLENYLTFINYHLILNIKEKNIAKLFEYSKYGMKLTANIENEERRLYYNITFIINYTHILHLLKLHGEIIKHLDETLLFRKYLMPNNLYVVLQLKASAYRGLKEYDKALECLFECMNILDTHKVDKYFNIMVSFVNVYLEINDLENADKYYELMLNDLDMLDPTEQKIFYAISVKYYHRKGNKEKALDFLTLYVNCDKKIFYEKLYLDLIIDIAKEISKDLYFKLLENYLELSKDFDVLLEKLYSTTKDEYRALDKNFTEYYKYLYNQFSMINTFHLDLNKTRNLENILQVVSKYYTKIFEICSAEVHIVRTENDIKFIEILGIEKDNFVLHKSDNTNAFSKLFVDDASSVYFNIFRDTNENIFAFLVLKSKYNINFKSDKFGLLDVVNEYVKEYIYNILEFEKTKMDADYDFLTKLYNRHGFFKNLEKRFDFDNCTLAILDLDDFKYINDTYSHIAGDRVLIHFSNKLVQWFGTEAVSRYGGEEFIVLINEDIETSFKKLDEFRKYISITPVKFSGNNIYYTFSGGITILKSKNAFTIAFQRADDMLYQAKSGNKNEIVKDRR